MKTLAKLLLIICLWFHAEENCFARVGKEGLQIGAVPPSLILQQSVQGPPIAELTWEKFKGKVVVLEFWDTQCVPCVEAIPHWNELMSQFSNQSVVFLSITDDNLDHLKSFLKLKPMKGWMAIDDPFGATRTAFVVTGIPHTVLVDQKGKIAAITHPIRLKAEHLEELLKGKPSSLPPPTPYDDEEVTPVSAPTHRIVEISISGPFPQPHGAFGIKNWNREQGKFTATKDYLADALGSYFGFDTKFVISDPALPNGLYDITISGPTNKTEELRFQFVAAFETAFGFSVRTNNRVMKVYEMTLSQTNSPNLRLAMKSGGGGATPGGFGLKGSKMKGIAGQFAHALNLPVLDETHSTNIWQMKIGWKMSAAENLPYTIYRQAGRELAEKVLDDSDILPPEDKTLQAVRGKISAEDFAVLTTELARPIKERFQPDPENIIKAAREQLGIQLTLTNRAVPVLEIIKKQLNVH